MKCTCGGRNLCISCCLDDFAADPLALTMLAYPLSATLAGLAASGAVTAQDGRRSLSAVIAPDASFSDLDLLGGASE